MQQCLANSHAVDTHRASSVLASPSSPIEIVLSFCTAETGQILQMTAQTSGRQQSGVHKRACRTLSDAGTQGRADGQGTEAHNVAVATRLIEGHLTFAWLDRHASILGVGAAKPYRGLLGYIIGHRNSTEPASAITHFDTRPLFLVNTFVP